MGGFTNLQFEKEEDFSNNTLASDFSDSLQ